MLALCALTAGIRLGFTRVRGPMGSFYSVAALGGHVVAPLPPQSPTYTLGAPALRVAYSQEPRPGLRWDAEPAALQSVPLCERLS